MITNPFILANMSNKGALANFSRSNNWKDLQFFRTMMLCIPEDILDRRLVKKGILQYHK
jgi:hypothetical protein